MEVTLAPGEEGFFKKRPTFSVKVEFSNEEKARMHQAGLEKYTIFTVEDRSGSTIVTGSGLLKQGWIFTFDDRLQAQSVEVEIRDALKKMKEVMDASHATPSSDTFEL